MRKLPSSIQRALATLAVTVATLAASHGSVLASPACELGQGDDCASSNDCAANPVATLCAASTTQDAMCEVPCAGEDGQPDLSQCSFGETCVPAIEPGLGGGDTFVCKSSKFAMDLNLLDSCIYHFVGGLAPDFSNDNACSVFDNLAQLLDQDSNNQFNILDVDLCVRSFLGEEACDSRSKSCDDGQVYCDGSTDCGDGLFCDEDLNKCSRECGFIVSRDGAGLEASVDRTCTGTMKLCDYDNGKCLSVDPTTTSCDIDQDCPSGAYCSLGTCAPRCYRSIDCPGSEWFCAADNTCQPRPVPDATERFNPRDYSVQFAQKEVSLDPIRSDYEVPILIMDLISKKQVFSQPNAVFGYRLEVEYEPKQQESCLVDFDEVPESERDALLEECIVKTDHAPGEPGWGPFISLDNPFGVLYGTGDAKMMVAIDPLKAPKAPGDYSATIRAIFSNGNVSTTRINYRAPSPNGEYVGLVSVYSDGPNNALGTTNVGLRLSMRENEDGTPK
ncbi:MAG: hypothetical protein MK135_15185, partial [Polyangiaceae bacterium]|nr:hypothetical protein [Polyangiaceae bacterium]